jgi:hypothetical protein
VKRENARITAKAMIQAPILPEAYYSALPNLAGFPFVAA